MLFTIGNFITLGLVLVVLVVYRQIDRDNRSLEKLKKYADRLRDELDAYVDKRAEDLKRFGIELDVRQKAAKVALDRVQSVQEGLAARAEAIGGIEKRLAEYDDALSRLMKLTSQVDENLMRLHEESDFTESVSRKLDAASATMEAIDREIPELKRIFADDAARALESFKGELVADVGSRLKDVALVLDRAKTEAAQALQRAESGRADLERELAKGFERARVEAERLEDIAFAKLKESSETKAGRLKELIEDKFAQLGALAREKVADTQGIVKTFKADWKSEAEQLLSTMRDEMAAQAESLGAKLEEAEARVAASAASVAMTETSAAETAARASRELAAVESRLASEGAALSARAFEEFGKRLAEYGSEAEARFERLEAQGAEIGALDSALRASMDQTARRVENDFAAFGSALEDRRLRFEEGFAAEAGRLRESMKALEDELDALKQRAYDNVSEKLKVFEDEFFADLKARSESAEARLGAWRDELDRSLSELAARAAEERAAVEKAVMDETRTRLAETQARLQDQLDTMRERVSAIQDGIQAQSGMASETLTALKQTLLKDASDARDTAQAYVEGEISRFSLETQARVKAAERDVEARLSALGQAVGAEEEQVRATRENVAQAAEAFRSGFRDAVAKAEGSLRSELQAFVVATTELVQSARGDYESQRDTFVQSAQNERDRITKELAALADRTAELRQDLSSRIAGALEGFSRGYEAMLVDLEKKRRETQAESEAALRGFKDAIQDLALKLESARAQSFTKVESEGARLSQVLADIDREQKNFVAQTKVFERTDELKDRLAQSIESMKSDLARLDARKAEVAEIETQIGRVKRLEDEVNQKLTRFLAEKRRIDALEEDFTRLAAISQTVDKRLDEVTGQADAITEAQTSIRKILELSHEAEAKYERLEKKSSVLDSTTEAVDKNFQAIQGVEKVVATLGGEIRKIPDRIVELRRAVDQLAADKDKTDEAVRKLGDLDGIIADAEKRIAEVQKAREWLARAETRLEEIDRKAQEQLKLLSTLLKEEGGGKRERGAPPATVQDTVRKLARQGWNVDEIARAVKVSRGEVELILELGGKS
jgi:DNA repair exonuclease SbcCD ATPase subunit